MPSSIVRHEITQEDGAMPSITVVVAPTAVRNTGWLMQVWVSRGVHFHVWSRRFANRFSAVKMAHRLAPLVNAAVSAGVAESQRMFGSQTRAYECIVYAIAGVLLDVNRTPHYWTIRHYYGPDHRARDPEPISESYTEEEYA